MSLAPLFLITGVAILLACYYLTQRGYTALRRPISAYQAIHAALAESTEAGQPIHLSLGVGGIHDGSALETLPGLLALEQLSEQTAFTGHRPIVTTASPTTLLLAQDVVRHTLTPQAQYEPQDALTVRFNGGQADNVNTAYTAGLIDLLEHETLSANVMLGRFEDDYVLLGELSLRKGIAQIAGSTNLNALPFMRMTAEHVLIGEELFAVGAYLRSESPWDAAGLLAQDVARWLLIGGVLALVALKTLQALGGV